MSKHTLLISDKFDSQGIQRLQERSELFNILYDGGYKRDDFLRLLPDANGLILRSSTKVDQEAVARAAKLQFIIRAGVGVDNIDISAASHRGIVVANAPGGNSISTAEQALALLFACTRHTAQANATMKAGRWEKSKFKGRELTGKTLGILGLGRIGKELAARAKGLQMQVLAYDPYMPTKNISELDIELVSKKEDIITRSDFISAHVPLTDDTKDFISHKNLSQLKKGAILINAARGGIYNEEALASGLESGQIGAVGLDVFDTEPLPENSPLRKFPNCVMTPHLGASTDDAELAVAMETVDVVIDYFSNGVLRNALNFPVLDIAVRDLLQPYYEGGICAAKLLAQLGKNISNVQINYCGEIARHNTSAISTAIQYGLLLPALGDEVNLVNAPMFAKSRGVQVSETHSKNSGNYTSYIQLQAQDSQQASLELKYTCIHRQAQIFSFLGLPVELKPAGIILSIKNKDIPGVVGIVGTFLGQKGVNIARLELSREAKGGSAYCLLSIDESLSNDQLRELAAQKNIIDVNQIDLR